MYQDGDIVDWRALMKYTSMIPEANGPWEDIMDIMQDLIPVFFYRTKLDTLFMWMSKAVKAGLIDSNEKGQLQNYLIHGYSGM